MQGKRWALWSWVSGWMVDACPAEIMIAIRRAGCEAGFVARLPSPLRERLTPSWIVSVARPPVDFPGDLVPFPLPHETLKYHGHCRIGSKRPHISICSYGDKRRAGKRVRGSRVGQISGDNGGAREWHVPLRYRAQDPKGLVDHQPAARVRSHLPSYFYLREFLQEILGTTGSSLENRMGPWSRILAPEFAFTHPKDPKLISR